MSTAHTREVAATRSPLSPAESFAVLVVAGYRENPAAVSVNLEAIRPMHTARPGTCTRTTRVPVRRGMTGTLTKRRSSHRRESLDAAASCKRLAAAEWPHVFCATQFSLPSFRAFRSAKGTAAAHASSLPGSMKIKKKKCSAKRASGTKSMPLTQLEQKMHDLLRDSRGYSYSTKGVRRKCRIDSDRLLRRVANEMGDKVGDHVNFFAYNDVEYMGFETRRVDYERDKRAERTRSSTSFRSVCTTGTSTRACEVRARTARRKLCPFCCIEFADGSGFCPSDRQGCSSRLGEVQRRSRTLLVALAGRLVTPTKRPDMCAKSWSANACSPGADLCVSFEDLSEMISAAQSPDSNACPVAQVLMKRTALYHPSPVFLFGCR